jgi:hypothetical protein
MIDRMISYQLHGRANLEFTPSGVCCDVVVPLCAPSEEAAGPQEAGLELAGGTGSRLEGLRVLVVEDDFDVALSLRSMLSSLGCEVIGPVSTAEDACEITSAPVARSLLYQRCPFLFVTGFANINMLPDDLRGQRVLLKPVDREELCSTMHELVA